MTGPRERDVREIVAAALVTQQELLFQAERLRAKVPSERAEEREYHERLEYGYDFAALIVGRMASYQDRRLRKGLISSVVAAAAIEGPSVEGADAAIDGAGNAVAYTEK